ncbi:hypothetical protein J0895_03440 [Phormidium pseudopriestleyi FRX01]|uniref:Uncharacterized protein n=2 Tax=Phormidium TaxID=1198 RepID=A0ABS3FM65_9CYAN|nr:hypothetical protein [Phormidium pseudopriestleyi FRX01]
MIVAELADNSEPTIISGVIHEPDGVAIAPSSTQPKREKPTQCYLDQECVLTPICIKQP